MINFDEEKCSGCGACANVCPQAVIKLNNRKAFMADYKSCMECGACQLNCEYGAIELTKGTG
jgi:NAD-dependent dihydropyrimidine dehydrogenase PreA subunit